MPGKENIPPKLLRASDADRDKAIELLREGTIAGRLSSETFLHRVDAALRARRGQDLGVLLQDLPAPPHRDPWRTRAFRQAAVFATAVRRTWHRPKPQLLALPRGDRAFAIGRSPDCDLVLADMTVSWRHAELRPVRGEWILADLGSRNGSYANGWRAGQGIVIRPGDSVRLGNAVFRIAP